MLEYIPLTEVRELTLCVHFSDPLMILSSIVRQAKNSDIHV